jgi:ABC-type microcin C transport system permease subunit YejB
MPSDAIEVDPDVLAEIKAEYGDLPDLHEAYNNMARNGLTFNFDVDVPGSEDE